MNEKMFEITADTPLYLYGAGKVARDKLSQFDNNNNFNFRGVFDRNAETNQNTARVSVYPLPDLRKIENDACIIITLQDCTKHYEVAESINREYDKNKLIFFPTSQWNTREKRNVMRKMYNYFLYDIDSMKNTPIPVFELQTQGQIIDNYGKYVSFYCDKEFIFSATEEIINESVIEDKTLLYKYADIPAEMNKLYRNLFDYLNGKVASADLYLDALLGGDKRSHLDNRRNLLEQYESAIEFDPSFFELSPIYCRWNKEKHFNIIDGNHRLFFLLSHGITKIPIVSLLEDYEQYTIELRNRGLQWKK